MPAKEDPWPDMERELETTLEQLNTARAAFTSRSSASAPTSPASASPGASAATPSKKGGGGGGGGGDISAKAAMSVEADELVDCSKLVDELLADARLAVDMAINHPEKFPMATTEIQRRQDLLRQWERRSEKARADAKHIAQTRRALSAGPASPGGGGAAAGGQSSSSGGGGGGGGDNEHTDYIHTELAQQKRYEQEQDQTVDRLREGVSRIKGKAVTINDELKVHETMLDDLDKEMTVVQVKIEGVMKKVGKLLDETSDRNKFICIVVLLIILGVMIFLLFSDSGSS